MESPDGRESVQESLAMESYLATRTKSQYLLVFVFFQLLFCLSGAAGAGVPPLAPQLGTRGWAVSWDEIRSVVEVAYGGTDMNVGFVPDSAAAVDAASLFFSQNAALLGTRGNEIWPTRVAHRKDRWNVTFSQFVDGIPVEGGECSVLFTREGRVRLFGSSLFPQPELSLIPSVEKDDAILLAGRDLGCQQDRPQKSSAALVILPERSGRRFLYRLAWKVSINCECPYERDWIYKIDASNGALLARHEVVWSDSVSGAVTGKVQPEYPFAESCPSCLTSVPDTLPIRYNKVSVFKPGNPDIFVGSATTDANGHYSVHVDSVGTYKVKSSLVGAHCRVFTNFPSNPNPVHGDTVSSSFQHNWTWAGLGASQCDWGDSSAAINVFYHLNAMWQFFADPPFRFEIPYVEAVVNKQLVYPTCSAGYDPSRSQQIQFYTDYENCCDECANPALDSDVIYHEFTHHVLQHDSLRFERYYEDVIGEAMPDYFACVKNGDSDHGEGFRGTSSYQTRHLNNSYNFPRDWQNLAYYPIYGKGQIVSGASWDLRSNLGQTSLADSLLFEALEVKPLNYFHHLAINVLEVDGYEEGARSPHYEEIAKAFAKHGIHFPTAPDGLSGQSSPYSISLSWPGGSRGPGRHVNWTQLNPDTSLTASDTTRIVAYRVFRGLQSRTYTDTTDFPGLSGTVGNLTPGVTHYFAVAAVDSYGVESAYSNEISRTIPGIVASAQDDSLFVCPGWDGDSLVIRVAVYDSAGIPIDSIPADSVYARVVESTGNALLCYGSLIFADSATSSNGRTTISVLQMGGCGTLGLKIVVHTSALADSACPDTVTVWLRSADMANGDCKVASQDQTEFNSQYSSHGQCADLNWDGAWTSADSLLFANHYGHPITVVAPNGGEEWVPGTRMRLSGLMATEIVTILTSRLFSQRTGGAHSRIQS